MDTPEGSELLTEGKATVIHKKGEVFYNPLQQFNRDMSIMTIKHFISTLKTEKSVSKKPHNARGIDILEALSATGLRSIRYFKEIEGINSIIVNDMDPDAVAAIRRNLEFNQVPLDQCIPNQADAKVLMYQHAFQDEKRFDVIDLDPYGSATIFLDAAIQAADNGGLLCITCTDSAVLCGGHKDQLWSQYQSASMKGRHQHEFALRVILKELNGHAARYKRSIEPLVSLYVDFYFRIFVRVYDSGLEAKKAFSKVGMAYQCTACMSYWTSPFGRVESRGEGKTESFKLETSMPVDSKCPHCASKVKVGGPIWLGPLHSHSYLDTVLQHLKTEESKSLYVTHKRMLGLLSVCREELNDVPLFYCLSGLCNVVKLPQPSLLGFRSAVVTAGYQISGSHCMAGGFKTNAPNSVLWDIIRSWHLQQNPVKDISSFENTPAGRILSVAPRIQADFKKRKDAESLARELPRYIKNPGQGPLPRAKGTKRSQEDGEENKKKKQKKGEEMDED